MKYDEKNNPLVCMQTQSTCYRGTRKMQIKGVLWHSTGANNPNLKRYIQPSDDDPNRAELLRLLGTNRNGNDWNHIEILAGLNCWIGKLADGRVTTVQTMPWDYRPWGCGSGDNGSCNTGWVQFEICEDGLEDGSYFDKVYKEACEITAYLCKLYEIDPYGVVQVNAVRVPTILCHIDSFHLGMGSRHGDVMHWFPRFGKSMETVRSDVATLLRGAAGEEDDNMDVERFTDLWIEMRKSLQDNDQSAYSKEACDWCIANKIMVGGSPLPDGSPNYMYQDVLTREQMCVMMYRFAKLIGEA